MPIVLVGLPGSGKTTVGRLLADQLKTHFLDSDEYIEAACGKPITQIFAEVGESGFRMLEQEAIAKLLSRQAVLSPGGGAVTNPVVREMLEDELVVWLQVSPEQATSRIGDAETRPLLVGDPIGKLKTLSAARAGFYEQVANLSIDTDSKTAAQVVAEIVEKISREEVRE